MDPPHVKNMCYAHSTSPGGDTIEVYKIITGKESIDGQQFFEKVSNEHNLRGHTMKLYKGRSRLGIRKHFFSNRVVNEWNSLPQMVIDSESVHAFKNKIDKYWKDAGNDSFGFSTRESTSNK